MLDRTKGICEVHVDYLPLKPQNRWGSTAPARDPGPRRKEEKSPPPLSTVAHGIKMGHSTMPTTKLGQRRTRYGATSIGLRWLKPFCCGEPLFVVGPASSQFPRSICPGQAFIWYTISRTSVFPSDLLIGPCHAIAQRHTHLGGTFFPSSIYLHYN